MEYVFAYLAGLLTLINPCVIPVLPIVLASAVQADRRGPLALAAGMSVSFVGLGVGITAFGHLIGLTVETLATIVVVKTHTLDGARNRRRGAATLEIPDAHQE